MKKRFGTSVLALAVTLLVASSLSGAGSSRCVYAYIATHGANTVSVVDTSTNTIVDTITLPGPNAGEGGGLEGVAITPDGKFVYVANVSGLVSVINTVNDHVIATITIPGGAYGLAASPDGQSVYVTSPAANAVSQVAVPTNTVVNTTSVPAPSNITAGQYNVSVLPNGQVSHSEIIYVLSTSDPNNPNGFGSVSEINVASGTVENTVQLQDSGWDIAVSVGGRYAYVTSGATSSTGSIVDFTNNSLQPFGFFGAFRQLTISPNGLFLYIALQSTMLFDTEVSTVPNGNGTDFLLRDIAGRFAFTPDGKFAYSSSGGIVRVFDNFEIGTVAGITGSDIGVAVSPTTVGCLVH